MDGEGAGKWLFIGLTIGALLMLVSFGLPETVVGIVAPDCGDACLRDLDLAAQQGMSKAAWAMFAVTALSVGVGAVSLWLIWKNLVETRRIVLEAQATTRAAERSNDTMVTVARQQSRAYLDVVGATFQPTGDQHRLRLKYVNSGQTPARTPSATVAWAIEYQRRVGDWHPIGLTSQKSWIAAVPAGGGDELTVLAVDPKAVDPWQLEEAQQHKMRYVLRGLFQYQDVFGDWHETQFQFRSDQATIFALLLNYPPPGEHPMKRLPYGATDRASGSDD